MMKLAVISALAGSAAAFAPAQTGARSTSLNAFSAVESKTVLFNGEISGPAIGQLAQVNPLLWVFLGAGIAKAETIRAEIGWVEPADVPFDKPGQLRDSYVPGDIGFDPLGLKPESEEEFIAMQNKELQNGRLGMLAAAGFLAQELLAVISALAGSAAAFAPAQTGARSTSLNAFSAVESKTVLFNGEISGPAIGQLAQVNPLLWVFLGAGIAKAETIRAEIGWVEPADVPFDKPGQLRDSYVPGDIGFDPLGLKPESEEEFIAMQNKELQNGRLGMLAAAGFLAQELVDGKGIIEHFS
ncbi:chlorophyll a-b binding domain-containing protein, partial [Skeletonema marinoi]